MQSSLLAFLSSRIKGSQEDIVTISLCYILGKSQTLNHAFTKMLCDKLHLSISNAIQYSPQSTGKNKERPDISGKDLLGNEIIICEAKFFAGLTQNQPTGYLERLYGNIGSGLIFICPLSREYGLWREVLDRVQNLSPETIGEKCVSVKGIRMSIINWTEVIDGLLKTAHDSDPDAEGDLKQLANLCKQIEDSSFIPFTSDDLSIRTAKNLERYYMVVNDVIDCLMNNNKLPASLQGCGQSFTSGGYVKFILLWELGIGLDYSRFLWKNESSESTPFWAWFYPSKKAENKEVLTIALQEEFQMTPAFEKCKDKNGYTHIALIAPCDETRDVVAQSITNQIIEFVLHVKERYERKAQK